MESDRDNKLRKKINLLRATCAAITMGERIFPPEEITKKVEEASTYAEKAWEHWQKNEFQEGRLATDVSLELLKAVAEELTPRRLGKALLRQLEKIAKY
jgi:hypothetical protein